MGKSLSASRLAGLGRRRVMALVTGAACLAMSSSIIQVATHVPPLPPATVGQLVAAAAQIQAVLGC